MEVMAADPVLKVLPSAKDPVFLSVAAKLERLIRPNRVLIARCLRLDHLTKGSF
jgi:hypothetical protein